MRKIYLITAYKLRKIHINWGCNMVTDKGGTASQRYQKSQGKADMAVRHLHMYYW